jgi:UDP-N-acetylglucosamine diphosphorylase/glucosamine-1-phosphate N-acetyltransferase
MRVAFFEDSSAIHFHPIALARPVFELVCGRYSLRERIVRHCEITEWGVFVREHLAEAYKQAHPEAHVNDFLWLAQSPTLVINGRWLPAAAALEDDMRPQNAAIDRGQVAFLTLEPSDSAQVLRDGWESTLAHLAQVRHPIEAQGVFLEFPWDLIRQNPVQLFEDHRLARPQSEPRNLLPQVGLVGDAEDVDIDPTARIDPFVVLDASDGPISIGPGVQVKPFAQICGPCHIDCASHIMAGSIRGGTTIGPNCRVGGEVECSILHGYVNKYHAGFLGHSYVCPWVNLGALTTNSDLKIDYSHVRVPIMEDSIDSGLTKVGCFIADHTKTAIGIVLNTGASIGAMSVLLPDGHLSPKHIPSFCKVANGDLSDGVDPEQAIRTARIAMGRRNCELSSAEERMWRRLYVTTRTERENAIHRHRERAASRDFSTPAARLR